jgi:hypothetical protein
MTGDDIGRLFEEAERRFDRAAADAAKTDQAIARADTIMTRAGQRSSAERAAAERERKRLNAGLAGTVKRVAAVIVAIWAATIVFGFFRPIGLFGLIGVIAIGTLLVLLTAGSSRRVRPPPPLSADLPAAQLADRLDSYLYRARPSLPPPAQNEIDGMLAALPALRPTLEQAGALDPALGDARRLIGTHLPGLIDRYLAVPPAYRARREGDEPSVDDRLVEALRAGRGALDDIGERLARDQVAAFETQGRFIENRYRDETADR